MFRFAIVLILLTASFMAQAQPQAGALSKCLSDNTTGKDRKGLARWVFLSMAAHPEIKQYAKPNIAAATDESSRTMAALLTRLLTNACVSETREAMKAGGPSSIQFAFQTLGQLAMQELTTDKAVNESMGLFQRYVDQKRLSDALGTK